MESQNGTKLMKTITVQEVTIPALGFGTFGLSDEVARHAVGYALDLGYRHIDTAQMYGNEAEVGQAIAVSNVPRQEIWLTTKIWPDRFSDGDFQRAADESVRRLGTEPDLLLLHWPNRKIPLEETVGALSDVKAKGLTNHIGISNFTIAQTREAIAFSKTPLIVNQVEYHPYLNQRGLLAELRTHGMAMTAYCPLAKGAVFRDRILREIGEDHGKSAGQVTLRWLLQQEGVTAIPRSSREANIAANFDIFDFALSDPEMDRISRLARPHGRLIDPIGHAPDWDDEDASSGVRRNFRRVARVASSAARRIFR